MRLNVASSSTWASATTSLCDGGDSTPQLPVATTIWMGTILGTAGVTGSERLVNSCKGSNSGSDAPEGAGGTKRRRLEPLLGALQTPIPLGLIPIPPAPVALDPVCHSTTRCPSERRPYRLQPPLQPSCLSHAPTIRTRRGYCGEIPTWKSLIPNLRVRPTSWL